MDKLYSCVIEHHRVLINAQYSKIGNCYPRIFIEINAEDEEYVNLDLALGVPFGMSKSDFDSWLDGTEIVVNDVNQLRKICSDCNINYNALRTVVRDLENSNEESEEA